MVEDQSEGSVSITVTSAQQNDYAPKARKPYTITKQRERWTDDEHTKFIEALKLHGRAWRRIQEHIGNKTAVQIRSHAQKFFSKVVRDGAHVKPVEIPPPRAKRKPVHPYPRKVSPAPLKKIACGMSSWGSNQENYSPTSVLSVGASEKLVECDPESDLSTDEDRSPRPIRQNNNRSERTEDERLDEESSPESTHTQSFTLFGKTVLVTVPQNLKKQDKVIVEEENKCERGFVAYKRCLVQQNTTLSSILTTQEREEQSTMLCL